VTLESGERVIGRFRGDGNEQASGSLRIEKQILILGGDAGREGGAVTYKGAIVLESTGEMAFARRDPGD
jgi:hypothetical protein